jgi:hypoxanthine phosphoribosyltransferase
MSDPVLTPIGYEQFLADVAALAAAIRADASWTPEFIVGIGRGGLVPCTYLSHATGFTMLSIDGSSGVAPFAEHLIADLATRSRAGDRLLFIDDINDTGGTLERVRAMLAAAGAVDGAIRYGVLIDNIRSKVPVDYRARTIDRTVTKDWFVFPWEAVAPTATIVHDAAVVPERTA